MRIPLLIINDLTSTVVRLFREFGIGRSDHTATFMRSEKLALNVVRVGVEASDMVKCICRLFGQCFNFTFWWNKVAKEVSDQALR